MGLSKLPSMRWLSNPNEGYSHLPSLFFEAHMNVLFIVKVKILMLIKWSYRSSLNRLTSVSYVEYATQCFFKHTPFGNYSWSHTKPHKNSNVGV